MFSEIIKTLFFCSLILASSSVLASFDLEKANDLFNDVAADQSDYGCFKGNSVSKCLGELKRIRSNSMLSGVSNDQAILDHIFSLLKSQRKTSDFELVIDSGVVGFNKEKNKEFYELLYENYVADANKSGNPRYWVKAFEIKPSAKLAKRFANDASPNDLIWANNKKISINKKLKETVVKRIVKDPDFGLKFFTAVEEASSKGVKLNRNPSDDFLLAAYRSYAKQSDNSTQYLLRAYNISSSKEDLVEILSSLNNEEAYKLSQAELNENNDFKDLLEKKLRNNGNEDSLYYLAKLTLNKEDIVSSVEKSIISNNTVWLDELFLQLSSKVNDLEQIPQFFNLLNKCPDCKKSDYYRKAQDVIGFGKNLTAENFSKSVEYNYVLKNLIPEVHPIQKKRNYGFRANYGRFSIEFIQPGDCQFSHSITEEGFEGLILIKRVSREYDIYKCYSRKESNEKLMELSKIDVSRLDNFKQIIWDYYDHTRTEYLMSGGENNKYFTSWDQKNICLAATDRKNKYSCYEIKDKDIQNMCIGISEQPTSCYSVENKDIKNFCLAASGQYKNACYQIKDSELKEVCLGVSHYSNNCYNVKDTDLQSMCLGISKNKNFCYQIK